MELSGDFLDVWSPAMALLAGFGVAGAAVGLFFWIKSLLVLGAPNEAVVLFGRASGSRQSDRGYRIVIGGRAWRHPISEQVLKIDLAISELPVSAQILRASDGLNITVQGVAVIRVSSDLATLGNALERFLGKDSSDLRRMSREILESFLTDQIAAVDPENLEGARCGVAEEARRLASPELARLGLECDSLSILTISAGEVYDLQARSARARVASEAAIAASDAGRRAESAEADYETRSAVAKSSAEALAAGLRNQLRVAKAKIDAEVVVSEAMVEVAAREAKAVAETEHQQVLVELEELKHYTDLVLPAEAAREAREVRAKSDSAFLREKAIADGKAMKAIAEAWDEVGESSGPILALQDVDKLVAAALGASPGLRHRGNDSAVNSVRSVFAVVSSATGLQLGTGTQEPDRGDSA